MFGFEKPYQKLMRGEVSALRHLYYEPKPRTFVHDLLSLPIGSTTVFDTECFKNYFLAAFKHIDSGQYFYTDIFDKDFTERLRTIIWRFKIVGFNSRDYDTIMIEHALKGETPEQLKELSDAIILRDERPQRAHVKYNHVDLIEVAPLQASLKAYGARMHCQRLQEIPVDPHATLVWDEILKAREYCFNDLDVTELLLAELKEQIALRETLGEQYHEDLRSRSDAQIAEAVIASEFARIRGYRPKKSEEPIYTCRYTPPPYLQFQTALLQNTLNMIRGLEFVVGPGGYALLPKKMENLNLNIGKAVYRMSIGGLHSSETNVSYYANDKFALIDRDVASYYPLIIINGGVAPDNMSETFLEIYKNIVDRRIAAKKAKHDAISASLKITINGTFGKLGNPFSIMYSPELMLYVTITGQLLLLLLIEAAELAGIQVISANTDGAIFMCPREREGDLAQIVTWWEQTTGFIGAIEETRYRSYHARDVNNYIAIKENGEPKVKGAYCEKGSALNSRLSKNPEHMICTDAVIALLTKNVQLRDTIMNCRDVRRFVSVRNVKGGARKGDVYLGKVVRWYYAKGEYGEINYVTSGNKVPKSDGARPLMELGEFPADLDHDWYVATAAEILYDIGYYKRPSDQTLFG